MQLSYAPRGGYANERRAKAAVDPGLARVPMAAS